MGDALKALPDEASIREDVARWAPTEALALRFEQQPHEARIEYLQRVMGTHLYGNGMTFESREEAETVLVALERYELSYRKFLDELPYPIATVAYLIRDLEWEHGQETLRCHLVVESPCSP